MAIIRPVNLQKPFADAGARRDIPVDSQIGIDNGAASFTDGFPPLTRTPIAAGGIPPKGVDMNGILFALSQHTAFQNSGGQYRFDAALASAIGGYPVGAVLQSDNGLASYINVMAGNTTDFNSVVASIGVSWMPWAGAAVGGVVGSMRNGKMVITAASASATFTADEIIVEESLGGRTYRVAGFNKTVNLAIVGAGGMDSGTAPASGFVALYAIYNPTSGASALLAVNATATVLPEVYGGASMPAGYTASALVSVWPTTAARLLVRGAQQGRRIGIETVNILTSSVVGGTQPFTTAAMPKNAKFVHGSCSLISTNSSMVSGAIYDSPGGLGGQSISGYVSAGISPLSGTFSNIAVTTPQTLFYGVLDLGTPTFKINLSAYEF